MVIRQEILPSPTAGRATVELDATDRRILALLCEDGRMSMRSLAERAHVSRASAYARVERLRASGVITGFTARLDPAMLGLAVIAHVIVTVEQRHGRRVLETLRSMPEVAYSAVLAAEFDILLIVRASTVANLRDTILDRLNQMEGVRRTRTLLVLEDHTATDAALLASSVEHDRTVRLPG